MADQARLSPLSGRWDSALLRPVAELNELLLEILRAAAHSAQQRPRLVESLRPLWQALDGAGQRRLACCPYLLLDAGFCAAERWQPHLLECAVLDGPASGTVVPRRYFSSPAGVALVRRTLLFGWHLARSNRLSARVVLGMSAECAERIAATTLRDLDTLAELSPEWIAPRWEEQPVVWRQLIQAALEGPEAALRRVQSRGLQLLAAAPGLSDAAFPAVPHPAERTVW